MATAGRVAEVMAFFREQLVGCCVGIVVVGRVLREDFLGCGSTVWLLPWVITLLILNVFAGRVVGESD